MEPTEVSEHLERNGHCSALIKIKDDLSDLLFGHSSWFSYSNMNRIYKHYHLDFNFNFSLTQPNGQEGQVGLGNKHTSFSSYPGMLSSLDDFYMMGDSKLFLTQVT